MDKESNTFTCERCKRSLEKLCAKWVQYRVSCIKSRVMAGDERLAELRTLKGQDCILLTPRAPKATFSATFSC